MKYKIPKHLTWNHHSFGFPTRKSMLPFSNESTVSNILLNLGSFENFGKKVEVEIFFQSQLTQPFL